MVGCGHSYANLTNAESLVLSFNSLHISIRCISQCQTPLTALLLSCIPSVNCPEVPSQHTSSLAATSTFKPPSLLTFACPNHPLPWVLLLLSAAAAAFYCCLPLAVSACFHKVQSPWLPGHLLLSSHHCLSRAFTALLCLSASLSIR